MFNLKQSDVKNDNVVAMDMFERMGVIIGSEDVSDIIRMRNKEGDEAVKPVIVEFKSEYDKLTVLRNKPGLREIEEYKSCFTEIERSREKRELGRLNVQKKKTERRVEQKLRLIGCVTARIYVLSGRM